MVGKSQRKVTGLRADGRRCDGALTRFTPDKTAKVKKNGEFTLRDTTHYTDGFVTLRFSGKFISKTRATGTIAINASYNDKPCHYTLNVLKLVNGEGRPPHTRPPHH